MTEPGRKTISERMREAATSWDPNVPHFKESVFNWADEVASLEKTLLMKLYDERPEARVLRGGDGLWYWADEQYPDEGVEGDFRTRADAIRAALLRGYRVGDNPSADTAKSG